MVLYQKVGPSCDLSHVALFRSRVALRTILAKNKYISRSRAFRDIEVTDRRFAEWFDKM